jgi:hypothetical protein
MTLRASTHRACLLALAALASAGLPGAQAPGKADKTPPLRTTPRMPQIYIRERVEQAFRVFDRDHNEWLSFREIRSALEVDRREFVVIDSNSDGAVSLDEFDFHLKRQLDNGAVIRWPDGATASRPATAPSLTAPATAPSSNEPYSFGDPVAPAKPAPASRPASAPAGK